MYGFSIEFVTSPAVENQHRIFHNDMYYFNQKKLFQIETYVNSGSIINQHKKACPINPKTLKYNQLLELITQRMLGIHEPFSVLEHEQRCMHCLYCSVFSNS